MNVLNIVNKSDEFSQKRFVTYRAQTGRFNQKNIEKIKREEF